MGDTLYGLRLTLSKRLVLATAAVAAFVVPLAAGAINRATLTAEQAQNVTPGRPFVDPEARFEVVSIKRFDTSSGTPRASMTPGRFDIAADAAGGLAERQLAQCGQVRLLEEVPQRAFRLLRNVHLARPQAIHQLFRRDVDELQIIGFL